MSHEYPGGSASTSPVGSNIKDATMPNSEATTEPRYLDHEVVDLNDNTIGTVVDVIFDEETSEPAWLVVNPGLLQSERYVPIEGSYTSPSGNVVVPFDKRHVKQAPKAGGDHLITGDVESDLEDYYGLGDDAQQ